jgi:hypothetical protein
LRTTFRASEVQRQTEPVQNDRPFPSTLRRAPMQQRATNHRPLPSGRRRPQPRTVFYLHQGV